MESSSESEVSPVIPPQRVTACVYNVGKSRRARSTHFKLDPTDNADIHRFIDTLEHLQSSEIPILHAVYTLESAYIAIDTEDEKWMAKARGWDSD
ncbi:hypothetical protein H0H93_006795 [Arthromyces matolae]|nr:hypothetical protein H0H93_006795 [Arthromyces matolae]